MQIRKAFRIRIYPTNDLVQLKKLPNPTQSVSVCVPTQSIGTRGSERLQGKWYGCQVMQIDRFFPSSKTCHHCGHVKQDLTLSDRE